MRIINRYIWSEFFQQFLICVLGFTVLGIGKIFFDYNDLFIGYRVTPQLLWILLLNQIPALWMDVLPAGSLFGVILFLGRMLRERELDVIRLSGLSLLKIMTPVFTGVALICFLAYLWNDSVVPSANHRFEVELKKLSIKQDFPLLKENVIFKAPQNRFIYIKQVTHGAGKIEGVLIFETGTPEKWPRLITADRGNLRKGVWELYNGIIHEFDKSGAIITELKFEKMDLKMNADYTPVMGTEKSPAEMRSGELLYLVDLYQRSGLNMPVYKVFYFSKFSDPVISLILVFLAAPLTLVTGRQSRWLGLVYCFLIIMLYYALQVIGRTMGVNGLIPPWSAAWVPNLVFLLLGVILVTASEHRG